MIKYKAPFWQTAGFNSEKFFALIPEAQQRLNQHRHLVLVAPAGSGKTDLAMQLAQQFKGEVRWFNSAIPEARPVQMALTEDDALHDHISMQDWLNVEQGKWQAQPANYLFVIDHCTDVSDWLKLLPAQSYWVITTRHTPPAGDYQLFHLPHHPPTETTDPLLVSNWWLSLLEKIGRLEPTVPELTPVLQEAQNPGSLRHASQCLWEMINLVLPEELKPAGIDLIKKLLYFPPDQPIFNSHIQQLGLVSWLSTDSKEKVLDCLGEMGLLRPGGWPPGHPCYILPSLVPHILRQILPLDEEVALFTAVADQVHTQCQKFYENRRVYENRRGGENYRVYPHPLAHEHRRVDGANNLIYGVNHRIYQLYHLLQLETAASSLSLRYEKLPLLLADLGQYYEQEEWWRMAEIYFKKAFKKAEGGQQDQVTILYQLGRVYITQEKWSSARSTLVRALVYALGGQINVQLSADSEQQTYYIEQELRQRFWLRSSRLNLPNDLMRQMVIGIATDLGRVYQHLYWPELQAMCLQLLTFYQPTTSWVNYLANTTPRPSEPPVEIHILSDTPAEPEVVFQPEAPKISLSEKIALIEGFIKFKQEQQTHSPTLQAELVQDFWELAHLYVEINRPEQERPGEPLPTTGWLDIRSAYDQALTQAVYVYGEEGEITRQIAAEFYEWALPRSETIQKQVLRVLRHHLGKEALTVQALQTRLNKSRLAKFFGY